MGMSRFKLYRRILLPSALRRALPQCSNEVIMMLHTTSSLVVDRASLAQRLSSRSIICRSGVASWRVLTFIRVVGAPFSWPSAAGWPT